MGQSMASMDKPPHHRSGDHFMEYDADAWRRLSSTYLNQLMNNGNLTKDELDIIELERYWKNRQKRHQNNLRGRSLSPFEQQRRKHLNRLNAASSVGNLADHTEYDGSFNVPAVRNMQRSSHLTRKSGEHYHSLVNVASIHPTRDQVNDLASDLHADKNRIRKPVRTIRNEHFSPYDPSFVSFDFSNQYDSPNHQNASRFKRNDKPYYGHKEIHSGNGTELRNNEYEIQKYPANFRMPNPNGEARKFKEYEPKSRRNGGHEWQHQMNEQRQQRHRTNDVRTQLNTSSPDSGFSRSDSSRTIDEHRKFTVIGNMDQNVEQIVEKKRLTATNGTVNSNFKRLQQQSNAPSFRVNSREHLDSSYKTSNIVDFNRNDRNRSTIRNPNYLNNVRFYDDDDDDYDDDLGYYRRTGSARLMHRQQQLRHLIPIDNVPLAHVHYSDYYQRFDRPHLHCTKILYIIILIINIGLTVWESVYMHFASIKIKLGEPIYGRLYSMTHVVRHIWQSIVIVMIILNCLTTMVAIYAAIRQKYWPIFLITILFYAYAAFGAYSEFLRGSISSWLAPMICGHFGIILTHQIAIHHYSI